MQILTKFMGMVLLAIAMSMFATGAKGLLPGLAG
jgi:small neutral amino acid transporter SnatA (MarC family)